jgi:3'-phosphoadenosine 5'-phosphosulfate sulfotransferase (PAPS reductase)/FAD synthetase
MLDWLSMDVWIYSWANHLPINELYNYFDRAGCWPCPFGLRVRLYFLQYTHPVQYKILDRMKVTSKVVKRKNYDEEKQSNFLTPA